MVKIFRSANENLFWAFLNRGDLNLWERHSRVTRDDDTRKAFQQEFGAYRGLARVLKSPSNPQNFRKKKKNLEKDTFIFCANLWYAANPGSKEI